MPLKVLIIEDSEEYRFLIKHALRRREDLQVIEAVDGETGVTLARAELPNLIICDISMPNMTGIEVLRELNKESRTRNIPFIYLTAMDNEELMRQAAQLGAYNYLTKPFEEEELLESLELISV